MQIRFTMHWNNFTRSSGNAPLLWERMKSRQPFVSFHSEWHLTVFLTTGTDPSLSLRMTSYRFPHHGSKFFAGAHTRTLNVSRHSDSFLQSSFWMDARMLCEKDRKRDSDTEWRIYYLEWHLAVFLTTVTDPSLSLQDDALPWVLLYRQTQKWLESRLCRLFNIILNGRKNALWERIVSLQPTAHSW